MPRSSASGSAGAAMTGSAATRRGCASGWGARGDPRRRPRGVGPGGRGDARVGGYSTGMLQRLGIAAALLRSPQLMLLDEPTSGLDPSGVRAIATLVRELAADGVAILLRSE